MSKRSLIREVPSNWNWMQLLTYRLTVCLLLSLVVPSTANAARYEPGCLREQQFLAETLSYLNQRKFVGLSIPIDFGDPRFNDGYWEKMQYDIIIREPDYPGGPMRTRYKIVIHYNYNRLTLAVDDIKFVNTVQEGCVGQPIADAGNILEGLEDPYSIYAFSQGVETMWFGGSSWAPQGFVVVYPLIELNVGSSCGIWSYCGTFALQ